MEISAIVEKLLIRNMSMTLETCGGGRMWGVGKRFLTAVLMALVGAWVPMSGQQTGEFGMTGDGRFRNPVIASDFSDPDVIRVGEDYYGIASTFCFSPGMLIYHSRDLVNWEVIGHVVDDITFLNPDMGWERMNGYYNGIWAGSLRYHDGTFYCHFATPKGGWFVARTDDIRGRWEVEAMRDCNGRELRGGGWDDLCPLWDDDGQAYIVASNFGHHWWPHLFKMSADGTQLLDGMVVDEPDPRHPENMEIVGGYVVKPFRTAEAAKLYKWDGMYYIYFSEVRNIHGNRVRVPVMRRSRSLYGPYEEEILLHSQGKAVDKEPNQGAIVDTPAGEWYFVTHHGTGDFDGRVVSVLPVRWADGWPLIGEDCDNDGVGEMVWEMPMPASGVEALTMQTSDDFAGTTLSPQWEWNHQPRADKWQLDKKRGCLRLGAFGQLRKGEFFTTGNVVSQRYIRWEKGEAVAQLGLREMADGQRAGLTHFNGGKDYACLEVRKDEGRLTLYYVSGRSGEEPREVRLGQLPRHCRRVYLRTTIDFDGEATFAWSTDGKRFTDSGETFRLKWGSYRGDRIGLYTFNNECEEGSVDIERFDYEPI